MCLEKYKGGSCSYAVQDIHRPEKYFWRNAIYLGCTDSHFLFSDDGKEYAILKTEVKKFEFHSAKVGGRSQ